MSLLFYGLIFIFGWIAIPAQADPLDTHFMDIQHIRQSECLKMANRTFSELGFLNVTTVQNITVFANDPPYYGAILCYAENGAAFFVISGPHTEQRNQLINHVYQTFSKHSHAEKGISLLSTENYSMQEGLQNHPRFSGFTQTFCQLGNINEWARCHGRLVKLKGFLTPLPQVLPAPVLPLALDFQPNIPGFSTSQRIIQSYLTVADRQVILLSPTPIQCPGNLEVEGQLQEVSVKQNFDQFSYHGWAVYVKQYHCLS